MEFGRVHGRAWRDDACSDQSLRIAVTLETRTGARVVRDSCELELRPIQTVDDLAWHADQYTQETIGTDLTLEGWEAISRGEPIAGRGGIDLATVTYVVRRA